MLAPPIAQLVEQFPFKEEVVGSIPTGGTNVKQTCDDKCDSILYGVLVMTIALQYKVRVDWWEKYFHETVSGCDDDGEPTVELRLIAARRFRCLLEEVRIVGRVRYLCTLPDKGELR